MTTRRNLDKHIREQADLARLYAADGAYSSAGRVLMELARDVNAHALKIENAMRRELRKQQKKS